MNLDDPTPREALRQSQSSKVERHRDRVTVAGTSGSRRRCLGYSVIDLAACGRFRGRQGACAQYRMLTHDDRTLSSGGFAPGTKGPAFLAGRYAVGLIRPPTL